MNNYTMVMLKMIAEAGMKVKSKRGDDVHYLTGQARDVMEKNKRVVDGVGIGNCSSSVRAYETEGR